MLSYMERVDLLPAPRSEGAAGTVGLQIRCVIGKWKEAGDEFAGMGCWRGRADVGWSRTLVDARLAIVI